MKFFVKKEAEVNSHKVENHQVPDECPCILLAADRWNDYGCCSQFQVFYFDERREGRNIGEVKIIDNEDYIDSFSMHESMPDYFEKLDDKYCLLGQDENFYKNMKAIFKKDLLHVLMEMRDCATCPSIQDEFEKSPKWWSLVRDDKAEVLLRTVREVLEGSNKENWYAFNYNFRLPYMSKDDESVMMSFSFSHVGNFPKRVFGIIGKNAAGKTSAISQIPHAFKEALANNEERHPMFAKIITASNSFYDNIIVPKKDSRFNYYYCGLAQEVNGQKTILSEAEQIKKLKEALFRINKLLRWNDLKRFLRIIAEENCFGDLTSKEKIESEGFLERFKKSSSGQSALIYTFTNIISHIRHGSLLLFDEPETHLHPGAVTALMELIYRLLEKYDSYAVIATHSPLVLREIRSECVYVLERVGNNAIARKIRVESLGSSPSCIVEDVFGAMLPIQPYYEKIVESLLEKGEHPDEIIKEIKNPSLPLSMGMRVYVQSMAAYIKMKNEKS